ncbi:AAA family ATPase [Streptomyces sp. NPDC002057]|uniref:helix-turn-helix transcriptional regulator n=1 Tax=Streptomyces sp. NPDC002057 TaxID=3154664 RepID=UPI00331EEAD6
MSARPLLVEREREAAALSGLVERLEGGRSGALLLEGVAGIGKTALLGEARSAAGERGVRVLTARAGELEASYAFGVVRQLFGPLLAGADTATRAALLAGPAAPAAAVIERYTDTAGTEVGDYAALNGLWWLAVNAAERGSLLILVDDLQWADPPSLRFLAFLLPRLGDVNVSVVAAVRPHVPGADPLLNRLATDPAFTVLRPRPLALAGTSALLDRDIGGSAHPAFTEACHRATRGNPLLLRELARAVVEHRLPPDEAHAPSVESLGPHAVARLVARRRAAMSRESAQVAGAIALLGDDATLSDAAVLAGVGTDAVLRALDELGFPEIVCDGEPTTGVRRVRFVHPLIRSAVYGAVSVAGRARMHREAARLIEARGGDADLSRVAGHLLHTPPAGDPQTAALLRRAAARASAIGAPAEAAACLHRCLEEPPPAADRMAVLLELASVSLAFDVAATAGYLHSARRLAATPVERARIGALLGEAATYVQPSAEALAALERAAAEIEPGTTGQADDLRARVSATILFTAFATRSGRATLPERLAPLRVLAEAEGQGARLLDCALAYQDAMTGRRDAVERAHRALSSGLLEPSEHTLTALALALAVLLIGEDRSAMAQLDELMDYARRRGSLRMLATACAVRARGWILTGDLAEAEADAREGLGAALLFERGIARAPLLAPVLRAALADALLQQGRTDEARNVLGSAGDSGFEGPAHTFGVPRIRLALARGEAADRLADAALSVGRATEAAGIRNPAVVQWRITAAAALHAAGDTARARELAARELDLARCWGAPAPVGRALRGLAALAPVPERSVELLREAAEVLEGSVARLEYAAALADLGTALCAVGRPQEARVRLRIALDIADRCGAVPLAEDVRAAMRAAGARPRRAALTGRESLTPSERRVAELAALGGTNRTIAHQLFIAPKTVEVHLSRIYRKLGITKRAELAGALAR